MSRRATATLILSLLFPALSFAGTVPKTLLKTLKLDPLTELAPEVIYIDGAGKESRLSELHGKFVLLHFWATWCKPCREEMPTLAAFKNRLGDARVELRYVAVDPETDRSKVADVLRELKISGQEFLIRKDASSARYYAWGIPMSYLVDPEGQILARGMGMMSWDSVPIAQFKKLLDEWKPKREK